MFLVFLCLQVTIVSIAQHVYSIGLECPVPDELPAVVYGNTTVSNRSQCDVHRVQDIQFSLVRVGGATEVEASYVLDHCDTDSDCMHGGVCWSGVCQCAFEWCGAFCASPSDNVCGLPTDVSVAV